jgi:superfamily II DNA helicase RecQ
VPAYVIFHDRTLRAKAVDPPRDIDAMAPLTCEGAAKLARCGDALLALLSEPG